MLGRKEVVLLLHQDVDRYHQMLRAKLAITPLKLSVKPITVWGGAWALKLSSLLCGSPTSVLSQRLTAL
jgi:hypothetical protein